MRRLMRWAALIFALALLALGLYQGLNRDEPLQAEGSSAALGLMLLEQESGLYVLAVTQGSPADRSGVQPGDYLVASEDEEIVSLTLLEGLLDTGEDAIPLTLQRDGQDIHILLPVR